MLRDQPRQQRREAFQPRLGIAAAEHHFGAVVQTDRPAAARVQRYPAHAAGIRQHAGIGELVTRYRPDQSVAEIVFVNVNPQSTLLLGQARGAAISALVAGGIEVAEYTALQVKQAVVGNGHADKTQVQHMVRRLLSLPGEPSPDAADALACAIAHAHGGQGMGSLVTKSLRVRNGRLV